VVYSTDTLIAKPLCCTATLGQLVALSRLESPLANLIQCQYCVKKGAFRLLFKLNC
jgi:hypothetical protein